MGTTLTAIVQLRQTGHTRWSRVSQWSLGKDSLEAPQDFHPTAGRHQRAVGAWRYRSEVAARRRVQRRPGSEGKGCTGMIPVRPVVRPAGRFFGSASA